MRHMNENYGRDLDLNLLRVFAVVAESGSVTRAAARLYLTQPAVSAALRRLTRAVAPARPSDQRPRILRARAPGGLLQRRSTGDRRGSPRPSAAGALLGGQLRQRGGAGRRDRPAGHRAGAGGPADPGAAPPSGD